jgi:hypothetical protein
MSRRVKLLVPSGDTPAGRVITVTDSMAAKLIAGGRAEVATEPPAISGVQMTGRVGPVGMEILEQATAPANHPAQPSAAEPEAGV